jgi:hypothetical protein
VIAAFSQLHHFSTIVASFPALLFAEFDYALCSFVVFAFASSVPAHVAFLADFRLAFFAGAHVPACRSVFLDVFRFYPYATAFLWTVEAILGCVFCELPIPENLELGVEQSVDMFKRNLPFGAALWWHELWVGGRQLEDALETWVAHSMLAFQFRRSADRDIVGKTGNAFDLDTRRRWRWWPKERY